MTNKKFDPTYKPGQETVGRAILAADICYISFHTDNGYKFRVSKQSLINGVGAVGINNNNRINWDYSTETRVLIVYFE